MSRGIAVRKGIARPPSRSATTWPHAGPTRLTHTHAYVLGAAAGEPCRLADAVALAGHSCNTTRLSGGPKSNTYVTGSSASGTRLLQALQASQAAYDGEGEARVSVAGAGLQAPGGSRQAAPGVYWSPERFLELAKAANRPLDADGSCAAWCDAICHRCAYYG